MTSSTTSWKTGVALVIAAAVVLVGLATAQTATTSGTGDDRAAMEAAVNAYHAALKSGDSTAALKLLAPDVMVLESGYIETAEQYLADHLPADMEFAAATNGERKTLSAVVSGEIGWVISSSTARGEFRGRPVNSAGAELMVLERVAGAWRIRAIHWSSRRLEG
jgi:ketosteroid isomerase-like protein